MLHPIELHRHKKRRETPEGFGRAEFLWKTNETLHDIIHQIDAKIAVLTLPWVFLSERIFESLREIHGHIPAWLHLVLLVAAGITTMGFPLFAFFAILPNHDKSHVLHGSSRHKYVHKNTVSWLYFRSIADNGSAYEKEILQMNDKERESQVIENNVNLSKYAVKKEKPLYHAVLWLAGMASVWGAVLILEAVI